ncbi:hypothetical protein BAJUN_01640 [Bajunvirus bajun]|uniref:Uncharacterized protein n=1 Tax=Brevundimonas phage vB_BgoS-Bajun TaxID=2948594 RepID=A0A9E7SS05_9CAUD|nr:hypothetical protein BAJUN_01640 [Brevundimonas phage vB_BgoS-Bajun]
MAAYLAEHHLGLIAIAILLFGIIAAQVRGSIHSRSIALLKDRNERLLRIMERISGIRPEDV